MHFHSFQGRGCNRFCQRADHCLAGIILARSRFGDSQSKSIFTFIYNHIRNPRSRKPHTRLLFCNREGRSTPETPRWKVAGRQSSSVSVLLPTGAGLAPSVSEGERFGVCAAGIDSVGRVSWYFFHDSKHFARSLVAQAFVPVFLGAGR